MELPQRQLLKSKLQPSNLTMSGVVIAIRVEAREANKHNSKQ